MSRNLWFHLSRIKKYAYPLLGKVLNEVRHEQFIYKYSCTYFMFLCKCGNKCSRLIILEFRAEPYLLLRCNSFDKFDPTTSLCGWTDRVCYPLILISYVSCIELNYLCTTPKRFNVLCERN